MNRREFLTIEIAMTTLVGSADRLHGQSSNNERWYMPDEGAKHRRTWMAFGPSRKVWGDLVDEARANLALIARTISAFEAVTMLVRPQERNLAAKLCGERVELMDAELDDLWIRDFGPTFVRTNGGKLGAVDLNFNGWGEKQDFELDAKLARVIARKTGGAHLVAGLVGEGGGVEADGEGTAILTESCFLNRNRNPGMSKGEFEKEAARLLGLRKIIWLPGIAGKDITDGHTDFYARFARPGVVVAGLEWDQDSYDYKVTREHLRILKGARDAQGRKLEVVTLEGPRQIRQAFETSEFAAGYINYYVVNGAVIAPEFGDKSADVRCKETLQRLFPSRSVISLNIDAIAAGGGGIHCATQQEPLL